jgi:hypothetical protein
MASMEQFAVLSANCIQGIEESNAMVVFPPMLKKYRHSAELRKCQNV